MAKKVLVISGSPRRGGNSEMLCDAFLEGAREAGHTADKVFLGDCKIGYCTGCGVCNRTHQCVQPDDMAALLARMVEADVIVLSTPVYFYAMSGQLKTFIDRTVPRYTEIADKEFYYILAAAEDDIGAMQRVLEGLRGFTLDCLPGAVEKGIVYGVGAWEKGDILRTPAVAQAREMGRSI